MDSVFNKIKSYIFGGSFQNNDGRSQNNGFLNSEKMMTGESSGDAAFKNRSEFENFAVPAPYKIGDMIGEKYEILEILGKGGFGIVYLVDAKDLGGIYAMKTFRDEFFEDTIARERFKREAKLWIDMGRHPNIVYAYFIDEIEKRQYVLMEYIAPGPNTANTIEGYIKHDRIPDIARLMRWGIEFCHAMEYSYSKGLLSHRDIKPANIMITSDKHLKITDFGLADVIGTSLAISSLKTGMSGMEAGLSFQTLGGIGFGTPPYMPPEQFDNASACDERSDIYSFGAVWYQLISSGKLPFMAELPKDASDAERTRYWNEMKELHSKAPLLEVNSKIFPIVKKCMAKKPEDRYRSFAALRYDLEDELYKFSREKVEKPQFKEAEDWEWSNRGLSWQSLGKLDEAIRCYDRAISINPNYAKAIYNKGTALLNLQRHDEAIALFERAIAINPGYENAWYNKAVSLRELKKLEESNICWDMVIKLKPADSWAYFNKGLNFERLGDIKKAVELYKKAMDINPRNIEATNNLGVCFLKEGKYEQAIALHKKTTELKAGYSIGWYNTGLCLYNLKNYKEALACYMKAAKLDKNYYNAWHNGGMTHIALSNYDEAIKCFDRCIEINRSDTDAWHNKGYCLDMIGRYEEAAACYGRGLEFNPELDTLWYNKGTSLNKMGLQREAIECFERAVKINPNNENAWNNMGICLNSLGEYEKAIKNYQKVISVNPKHTKGWYNIGIALENLKKYTEAIEYYKRAVDIDEKYFNAYYHRAYCEQMLGNNNSARISFRKYLETAPETPENIEFIKMAKINVEKL